MLTTLAIFAVGIFIGFLISTWLTQRPTTKLLKAASAVVRHARRQSCTADPGTLALIGRLDEALDPWRTDKPRRARR